MKTKQIILAAGMGSRLYPLTENIPKGMVTLHEISIIENQINIARNNNIEEIIIVTGYRSEKIIFENITKIINDKYTTTNMVVSLDCALSSIDFTECNVIISYADIVYNEEVFCTLLSTKHANTIVVDDNWLEYWKERFDDPLSDAESCMINSSQILTDIGQKTDSFDNIKSQYIGLMKFDSKTIQLMRSIISDDRNNDNSFICLGKSHNNLYMTDLLRYLIAQKSELKALRIYGNWLEIDSFSDYKISMKYTKVVGNILKVLR
jgi:L-glutamine-phosphate cytidylyltransferase